MTETSPDASKKVLKTFHLQGKKTALMTFYFYTFTLFSNQRSAKLHKQRNACSVVCSDKAAKKPSAFHSSLINMNNYMTHAATTEAGKQSVTEEL